MMTSYKIRNWEKFQHYKDRNPPWIKLHVEILSSADWVMLDDASKLLAVVCMVVAAKHDGTVPDNAGYLKRVAYLDQMPNFKPLIECGFLEEVQAKGQDSTRMLADARPEKEAEAEKELERKNLSAGADQQSIPSPPSKQQPQTRKAGSRKPYPADFEEFWAGYPTDANMAKAEALVPWQKLSPEERKQAIAALPGFRAYCHEQRDWYRVVHAVKFLKARRFEQYAAVAEEKTARVEDRTAAINATAAAWNGNAVALIQRINRESFEKWFTGSELVPGPPTVIRVQRAFQRDYILSHYGPQLSEVFGSGCQVESRA